MDGLEPEVLALFTAERVCVDQATVFDHGDPMFVPLRRLWGMSLLQAVLDYLMAPSSSRRFRAAKAWIFYGAAGAANGFDNVARFLGHDPMRMRRAIVVRRSELVADPQALALIRSIVNAADDLGNAA
jgi:hypothetical protein